MNKLSASALSSYLESPRKFYWSYVRRIEPAIQSMSNFDHDKILGTIWSAVVDRFYKGVEESQNLQLATTAWFDQTHGWVPEKSQQKYLDCLTSWLNSYHQLFNPKDGVRNGSEKFVENDRFLGYLDGLSHDLVIHECKSTSRAKSVAEQLTKVQHSMQVKLYAVMVKATGIRIEFAFKDTPYGIFRSEILPVTTEQLSEWEQGLNKLADHIYSLGDDINNYVCAADKCSIVTKNFCRVCEFQPLCEKLEGAMIGFKSRVNTRTNVNP